MGQIYQPYEHWSYRPGSQRPTILGAPVRTEFFRASERDIAGAGTISPGAQFEFERNAVVTGILIKSDLPRPTIWDAAIQVTKNGRQALFTNGFDPLRVSPCTIAACFDPWARCFIPVDQGEIWKFDLQNNQATSQDTANYSLVLRVERFLEKPAVIPEYLTETTFYQVGEDDIAADSANTQAGEMDFLSDGFVSGLKAITDTSVTNAALLSDVLLDILLEGEIYLSTARQTQSPIDCHELSPLTEPWAPMMYPVSRHEKWQVFARNVGAIERSYRLTARVEELRVPWANW